MKTTKILVHCPQNERKNKVNACTHIMCPRDTDALAKRKLDQRQRHKNDENNDKSTFHIQKVPKFYVNGIYRTYISMKTFMPPF